LGWYSGPGGADNCESGKGDLWGKCAPDQWGMLNCLDPCTFTEGCSASETLPMPRVAGTVPHKCKTLSMKH